MCVYSSNISIFPKVGYDSMWLFLQEALQAAMRFNQISVPVPERALFSFAKCHVFAKPRSNRKQGWSIIKDRVEAL